MNINEIRSKTATIFNNPINIPKSNLSFNDQFILSDKLKLVAQKKKYYF
jgi:hypothetical protein